MYFIKMKLLSLPYLVIKYTFQQKKKKICVVGERYDYFSFFFLAKNIDFPGGQTKKLYP